MKTDLHFFRYRRTKPIVYSRNNFNLWGYFRHKALIRSFINGTFAESKSSNTEERLPLTTFLSVFARTHLHTHTLMAKCNKIRHIVRIRQMLRSWRNKAKSQSASHRLPPDVPAGYVAICVGSRLRRFIVRASYLNHPIFRQLLSQAEEEYGFANYSGPLAIPCDESLFEEILRFVSRGDSVNSESQRCRHAGIRNENPEFFGESRPLLYGFTS